MIEAIDPVNADIAQRIVYIQRSAYSVEACLIGFDGIPQLDEAAEDVMALNNLQWRGVFDGNALAGVIAWQIEQDVIEIDRLAIDPRFARRGHGRQIERPSSRREPTMDPLAISTRARASPKRAEPK
jgi:hypothetical protein